MSTSDQIRYIKTSNPKVSFNNKTKRYDGQVTYRSRKGDTGKRKYRTGFLTEADAKAGLIDFRRELEQPRMMTKNRSEKPKTKRRTVTESRAYNSMKRLSGWKKLTVDAWDNHPSLKEARSYADVMKLPRRTQINLANEFGMNIAQQLTQ